MAIAKGIAARRRDVDDTDDPGRTGPRRTAETRWVERFDCFNKKLDEKLKEIDGRINVLGSN